jgi:signal transduction histidine kinase
VIVGDGSMEVPEPTDGRLSALPSTATETGDDDVSHVNETSGNPVALQIYELLVVVPTLLYLIAHAVTHPGGFADPTILFWTLAIAVVDLMPVTVGEELQLSLSFPIELAVAMLFAPPVAMLITLLGSFDPREFRGELPLLKAMFIRSQVAISILCESALFHLLADIHEPWYRLAPAVAAAITVGYAVNVFLVAIYVHLASGSTFRQIIDRMKVGRASEFLVSYTGLSLFGIVIAWVSVNDGLWLVVVFVAPLAFGRQMYFKSRALSDRLAAQNEILAEQAAQLREHLDREQQAVAELKELNRMKSEFAAVASHELRTPLTAIIGYAKTLRQPAFAEDPVMREEFLVAMERQGDRLLRLVENLLLASNLENSQISVHPERLSLGELCRELIEGLGRMAPRVQLDLPPALPVMLTDRQLLGRVLANLMDNALKYSPDSMPCEIGAAVRGDAMEIWVRDYGVGISEEDQAKIFDRFYQADSSATRTASGVGLGLSLVKEIVTALGGSIDVESRPGGGSRFVVAIPIIYASKMAVHAVDLGATQARPA